VTLDTGETRTYGAVLVASGHHWNPRWPDFPGTFDGEEIHSHEYREPSNYADQRVMVVGIGNSACDIVVDLCRVAEHVTLSTRSSAWVLPKYILGQPLDQWTNPVMEHLPVAVRRMLFRLMVWLTVGNQEDYGLPKPDHKLMEEHPTISQELLSQIGHGRVEVRPNVDRLDGREVHFEDGTSGAYDAIIYATGYDIEFPFLQNEVFHVQNNHVRLYRYIVPPELPGLYFHGLIQPLGAIMPLVEKQGKWVAQLLSGEAALPSQGEMQETIDDALEAMQRRYTASPRHTIQVDFWDYVRQVDKEMQQGKKRARSLNVPSHDELEPVHEPA
jgi:cation diffusion facilitator CzcD-associated flavoprotein CzcO